VQIDQATSDQFKIAAEQPSRSASHQG
jgi:hypothetical protein